MAILSPGLFPSDQSAGYYPPAPSKAMFPVFSTDPNSKITPQLLLALGSGLLSGNTWNEQIANAGMGANTAVAAQQAKQVADATKNKTVQMLQASDPELATAVASGAMTPTEAFAAHLKKQQEATTAANNNLTSDIKEYNFAKQQGFQGSFMDFKTAKSQQDNGLGLNPQTAVDANGNPVLLQMSKDGKAVQTTLPNGVTISKKPIEIDAGTSTILLDPITRQKIGEIPKNIAGAEQQKAEGKLTGEAVKALPATLAKADSAIKTIDEALAEKNGLHYSTGLWSMLPTRPGSDSANFQADLKKIQGATFIQAYQDLRGTGAISEVEGAKAEDAIAALSVAQDEEHMIKALNDLRNVIVAGKERAKQMAGLAPADASTDSNPMMNPNVTNPANMPQNNGVQDWQTYFKGQ
jgi:hypothetical protein